MVDRQTQKHKKIKHNFCIDCREAVIVKVKDSQPKGCGLDSSTGMLALY
jgi:hypothetical protein